MGDTHDNPMGTDGFEFVEYTAPDPQLLRTLFERLGFPAVARHRSKNVTLHRQGGINFIINAEPESFAQAFARAHGPSACAMAFRVRDAARAFRRAKDSGSALMMKLIPPWRWSVTFFERWRATAGKPSRSKSVRSSCGSGAVYSTNSKPSVPMGLSCVSPISSPRDYRGWRVPGIRSASSARKTPTRRAGCQAAAPN